MQKIMLPLCLTAIAASILIALNRELSPYQGVSPSVILHGASLLALIFLAFAGWRGYHRPENRPCDADNPLFMYAPGAVMRLRRDFTIIEVNDLVCKATGLRPGDLKGKKCYDLLGDGQICRDCLVAKVFASGVPEYGSRLKYDRDGKELYGEQAVIPIKDGQGNIEYVYEIMIDITLEVSLERENVGILMDVVTSMAHLIESRDPSTRTHSTNVQRIALAIARNMDLSDSEIKELGIAAILHDIGKIGIPESVLNKPGRLTDDEFSIIRRHPLIGYDAIKHIRRLQDVSEAIRDHHEHYNGQGYPHGRRGEETSVSARILAVADVFEALTSDRVYRKAMSERQALDIIQAGKGQQFDPAVVDALLALVRK